MGQLRVDDDAVRTGAATQTTDWQIGILNQTSKLKLSKQQTEKGWGWAESSAANSSVDKANNMAVLHTTPQRTHTHTRMHAHTHTYTRAWRKLQTWKDKLLYNLFLCQRHMQKDELLFNLFLCQRHMYMKMSCSTTCFCACQWHSTTCFCTCQWHSTTWFCTCQWHSKPVPVHFNDTLQPVPVHVNDTLQPVPVCVNDTHSQPNVSVSAVCLLPLYICHYLHQRLRLAPLVQPGLGQLIGL